MPFTATTDPPATTATTVITVTASTDITPVSTNPVATEAIKNDPTITDTRVSWVYLLKKEDLLLELEKFKLDSKGTVDILRKRLITFIKEGKATPAPCTAPFEFPTVTNMSTSVPTAYSSNIPSGSRVQLTTSMPSIPRPVTTSYIATSQPPSTSHFPNVPIVNIQSSTPSTPTNIQLKVHKWNIHFDGRNDPVTFIERLLEICESQLIPLMPELLQGEAAL